MPMPRLTVLLCSFLGLTLLGMHAVPALLPMFVEIWSLSNTEAGWLAGMPYLAFMFGVAFVGLTDRFDARRMMIAGALVNVVGYGAMGFAEGFHEALVYRTFQGLGFAWTYMPGVKALSDRIAGWDKGRAVSIYVSSFAIGSSFSLWFAAQIDLALGWQWAFILPAAGNLLAAGLVFVALPAVTPTGLSGRVRILPDFRAIPRNRPALGFVIGSFTHSLELLGVRAWTVTFLTWVAASRAAVADGFDVPLVAALLILIGVPTSLVGGEIGQRIGHARASYILMAGSAVAAALVGFSAAWPLWLLIGLVLAHNILVLADSGTLNAGAINAARTGEEGNTLAAFGMASAAGGLIGPVLFGTVLDLAGGGGSALGWGWAFASLGLAILAGAIAVRLLSSKR